MLARLRSLARALFGRSRLEDDMAAEMRFHLQSYAEDLIRSGVEPQEARRRAALEFGSLEKTRQECRESRGLRWPDEFVRNVRYALRMLRKSPGFASAAVATLALCIGANTAIFSIIDAVLLRPLPYPQPSRLMQVVTDIRSPHGSGLNTSQDGAAWELLRDHSKLLDYAAMSGGFTGVNLAWNGTAQYVQQSRVTAGYFRVLGVPPAIGREFTPDEDREGGAPVAVLSHDLWMRAFNGDRGVVGRAVLLRGEPHTVVGVMPRGFRSIYPADLWAPLRPSTRGEGSGDNYLMIARLRDGVSIGQGGAEVESLGRGLMETRRIPPDVTARLGLEPLQEGLAEDARAPLYLLWAAVGLVLLIGCLNIAGLMLVRAASRTREIATRVALGGGQGAVIRQLLTESLVVAMLGGLAGALVGYLGIEVLRPVAEKSLGVWQEVRLDWRVLAMTGALSLLTSILFGLLPAVKAARLDVRASLVEGGARGIAGGHSRWPRRLLVFGEVALGMVLLAGAGLMTRSFLHLRQLNPGFDGTNVLTASLSLQDARYATAARANRLFTETLERIAALPGVESAAVSLGVPYERWLNLNFWRASEVGAGVPSTITALNYSTPGYFRTLRIPVLAGRDFNARDTSSGAPVAIVSRTFAVRYLKGQDPLGARLLLVNEKTPREIVGVVGDVQQRPGWGGPAPLTESPAMFIPAAQTQDDFLQLVHTWFAPKWIVRASGARESIVAGMRRAVEQTDPLLPFAEFQTLTAKRDETLSFSRLQAILLGSLAALALALAALGIYALIASSAVQRTREMGIRMALGASLGHVMMSLVLPGLAIAGAGVVVGSFLAFWSIRALRSQVYSLANLDVATLAGVAAALLLVAAAASTIPALRMTRLNPASTLHDE
jgi:predicted permease